MNPEELVRALQEYDGPECTLMEVCGTHTAAIVKSGIPSLLSERIHLISGPGCPVCVTVTSYIDRLVELSLEEHTCVYAFGDLLRVKGSSLSLAGAKAQGGRVRMVYSPMEMLDAARQEPETTHVFAAVGFETTAPVYAVLLDEAIRSGCRNIRLLTSLKTMPQVIRWLCLHNAEGQQESNDGTRDQEAMAPGGKQTADAGEGEDAARCITGFLAPGHVCAVTGYEDYEKLAEEFGLPFIVSGFEAKDLLASIYGLVQARGKGIVRNFYPSVVKREGNPRAEEAVSRFFAPCDAAWRGMGIIPESGRILRPEYADFDAGSLTLTADHVAGGCRCPDVLMGKLRPYECPMFATVCTPQNPNGSCMVSQEGSCYNYYVGGFRRDCSNGMQA